MVERALESGPGATPPARRQGNVVGLRFARDPEEFRARGKREDRDEP
jgi:hypothetical protein